LFEVRGVYAPNVLPSINQGVRRLFSLRQVFVSILLVFATSSALGQSSSLLEVEEGVYSYGGPSTYISMFVVSDSGVIVIDPMSAEHAEGLMAAIRSVTNQPIRYLVYSHNHWDHSTGGKVFKDEGATIIAHVDADEWIRSNPHPDLIPPDEGWGGSRKNIVLGNTTLELYHFGPSHGRGMTISVVAGSRVAYVADLVAPKRLPYFFLPDFNVTELERTLQEMATLDIDKVVYTHNSQPGPLQGGTGQDFIETLQFLTDLRAEIAAEVAQGTPPRQAPDAVKLPKYEDWLMYDQWLALNAWKLFFEDHLGPF
jgi:glyoxylase-like metal-dependent hydrolase (beta-lactamase superfamily II)